MREWKRAGAVMAASVALLACGSKEDSSVAPPGSASAASPVATALPTAAAVASAAAKASATATTMVPSDDKGGAMVTIAAGSFKAGSRCYDVPRMRQNELENQSITLAEFNIDKYPYPNKPGAEAMLNVTRVKAAALCEAQGKRLCTEMEWERACKGDKSTTFMWGNGYKKGLCDGQKDHKIGARDGCVSPLGVHDMIGLSLEWTASDWDRGTTTGDAVVRGARAEKVSWLSARCTHTRKRNPNKAYDNIGFRCCSGPANPAAVSLRYRKQLPVVEDPGTDDNFEAVLMKAMPRDHRGIVGVKLTFDEVYRWHPVPKEEVIIARWKGAPKNGKPFYEIAVFKLCGHTAWLSAHMRGPVHKISKPKVGVSPRKIGFDIALDDKRGRLKMRYWHGHVKMTLPSWVHKGNQPAAGGGADPAASASAAAGATATASAAAAGR